MMSKLLTESDIIFPHVSNTPNLSSTLSSLKRSTLSIHNRMNSIITDSQFVSTVSSAYDLPLVANERCGSWYIPPENKVEGVYFKSTDGHMGQWGFSLRRLNLQLLDVVERYGGAVIVDSTRRGKSMPDALSKTVPMWCCAINRAVLGEKGEHELYTPPTTVGESEHSQMDKRVDGFVKQFLDICKPNLPALQAKLQKPLRPIWVTQKSSLPDSVPSFPDLHPIVLCTASRRVQGAEASENGYIQGAADDHEAWSHGLTPPVFWKNKKLLMATNEEDAPGLVAKLLEQEDNSSTGSKTTLIQPTSSIFISSSQAPDLNDFDAVISCTPEPIPEIDLKSAGIKNYIHLKCQTGKLGSRDLRNELPRIPPSLESSPSISTPRLLVCCPTEKDLSVGTALAILCLYVNDAGALNLRNRRPASEIDKTFIKQRLSWITTSNPTLNPSRATLQSVNAFLLTSQDPKTLRQQAQHTLPIHSIPSSRAYSASISTPSPSNSSIQRTIFTNLYTTWSFHRTLTSVLPTHPSGTVTGTATFTPCTLPDSFPNTLLYAEEGDFVTTMGYRMSAKRKYVYQLADGDRDSDKTILVRFFDDENLPRGTEISGVGLRGEYIGGLFVEMGRLTPTLEYGTESQMCGDTTDGKAQYVAGNRESHLCGEDIYAAKWRFGRGVVQDGDGEQGDSSADMWWEVTYDVKGPKKDYKSVTRYEKVRT